MGYIDYNRNPTFGLPRGPQEPPLGEGGIGDLLGGIGGLVGGLFQSKPTLSPSGPPGMPEGPTIDPWSAKMLSSGGKPGSIPGSFILPRPGGGTITALPKYDELGDQIGWTYNEDAAPKVSLSDQVEEWVTAFTKYTGQPPSLEDIRDKFGAPKAASVGGSDSGFRSAMLPWTMGMTPAQQAQLDLQGDQLTQQGEQFDETNKRLLEQQKDQAEATVEQLRIARDQLAESIANNQRNYGLAKQQLEEQMRQFNTISPYQQAQLDRMAEQLEESKRQFEITNKRLEYESARAYDLQLKVQRVQAAQQEAQQSGYEPRGAPGFNSISIFGG